jgi:CubicO group peptidase (beta-lactamase class C family)
MTLRFLTLLFVVFMFCSCQVGRFVFYNFADIRDYKKFPSRALTASGQPYTFHTATQPKAPKTITIKNVEVPFEQYLKDQQTVAFLVIRNDTLLYENYFDGYSRERWVPSFSMAKSFTSILIGCAVEDGLIKSIDEPVSNYIPELKPNGFDRVKISHVLQMTSGLEFNESYVNPFGHAASFYYGRNLRKRIPKLQLKSEPGTQFEYQSGNTQLLGLILERALKDQTVTGYFQEKIWTPLNMQYDASWSLDKKKDGLEKTFCCVNATALDFAKIGRLYLNNGQWDGRQLVPAAWVEASTKVDTSEGSASYYQYQWWLPNEKGTFMAQGILGQYIYVNPSKNLIMVRLGKKPGNASWRTIFETMALGY